MALHAFSANDSIPPVFTNPPADITVFCSENLTTAFETWYAVSAGAEADNGQADIMAVIDLDSALVAMNESLIGCSMTGSYELGFFAIDSCGLISEDTLSANFIVIDQLAPQITVNPQDLSLSCTSTTLDSLIEWISQAGFAQLQDNCDPNPQWINYNWTDSDGNSGFGLYSEPIVFEIPRENCLWSADFTFFVQDECGNISTASAVFEIVGDDELPELISFPNDTTILCSQSLSVTDPVFIDGCDGQINLEFSESNTQSNNPLDCSFYDYSITRRWTGMDACNNIVEYTQNISVVDTVAPTINFESIIAKDCDEDLSNLDDFIEYQDNCAIASIFFQDSMLNSSTCVTQLQRRYTITDFCGNVRRVNQQLQIEDFSGPEFLVEPQNERVACDNANLNLRFNNWVNAFGNAIIDDNCNTFQLYARPQGGLTNVNVIVNGQLPSLEEIECRPGVEDNIIFEQEVFFYAIDACNNISQASAFFSLADTIAPVIPNCPRDQEIILDEDECEIFSAINLPFAFDPCLDSDDIFWDIKVDEVFLFENTNESIDFNFDIGTHIIEYILEDCAGNTQNCIQSVEVIDGFPPEIQCPQDQTIYLEQDSCAYLFNVPEILGFSENCFGTDDFSDSQPEGEAFISFLRDDSDSSYSAQSFTIEFDDIPGDLRFFKPTITIDYQLNIDIPSRVVLKSELSEDLFIAEKAPCVRQRERLIINESQFEIWALDGEINFGLSVEQRGGKGILPCAPENLDGPEDIDEVSFFKITLEYTDIDPDFIISNSLGTAVAENEKSLLLEADNYNIEYFARDLAGNENSCITQISILDTISPTITCLDQDFVLETDTEEFIPIDLDELNINISDNCDIDRISFFPSDFNCQQIGRDVSLVVQAWDVNDNFNFCTATLSILGADLNPQFIGGLCLADTLKLFANVDVNINGTFNWRGPAGFSSSFRNPVITNISNINSGLYTLELETSNGCPFSGSVMVEVEEFLSPEITASQSSFCEGDSILINSNSYSEDVSYFWYEGISPDGALIAETEGPSLRIGPDLGTHFYYVQVEGQGCQSNPSNTLQIEIISIPETELVNQFISVCEGDNITFEINNPDSELNYDWTGPDGYISQGPQPSVINNADQDNAGQYFVTSSNGLCISDPITIDVQVDPLPAVPEIIGDQVYCEGETVVLQTNGNIGENYLWYFNDMLYESTDDNSLELPNISIDLSGNWTVEVEDLFCRSIRSEDLSVIVESMPVIGASNSGPVCEGDSVRITASFLPNAFYEWLDPDGQRFFDREISPLAKEGNYTVTVTSSNGCQDIATTFVNVGDTPSITALSNDSQNCMMPGDTVQFFPTIFPVDNYNYTWEGPDGFNSSDPQPFLEITGLNNNGTYSLIVSNEDCESKPNTTALSFNFTPDQPIILGPSVICDSDSLNLEIANPFDTIDIEYIWTTPQGLITTDVPELNLFNLGLPLAGQYSVVQIVDNCMSDPSEPFRVDLINGGTAPFITGPQNACEGSIIVLSSNTEQGEIFNWIIPSGDTIRQDSATLIISDFNLSDVGSYQLIIQNINCNSAPSNELSINLSSPPLAPSIPVDTFDICIDELTEFGLCLSENNDPFEYIELFNSESGELLKLSQTNCFNLSTDNFEFNQSIRLYARAYDNLCYSANSDTFVVNIYSSTENVFEIEEENLFICDSSSIELSTSMANSYLELLWYSDDPNIIFMPDNATSTSVSNLNPGLNFIYLDNIGGSCGLLSSDTISIQLLNDLQAKEDIYTFEYTDELILTPLVNDIYFSAVEITDVQSEQFDDISINGNRLTIINSENLFGQFLLEYEICYFQCPDICTTGRITVNITDSNNCITGNVITPNNDGFNDLFRIPCLDSNFQNNSLVIFNEWGDEILRASPYLNDWDGTYQGEDLPSGTYFYWLNLGDGSSPLNGFIVLER